MRRLVAAWSMRFVRPNAESDDVKHRRVQFSLRFLFVVVTIAGVLAFWFRPRYVEVEFAVTQFTNELEFPTNEPYVAANVKVTNRSPNALWYHGASPGFPDFFTSQRLGDKWQGSGYSYKPAESILLPRGESIVFKVPLYNDAQAVKVGIDVYTRRGGAPSGVWSGEFPVRRPDREQ
jgi:hypothetical protein